MGTTTVLKETTEALVRMQQFDVNSLSREADLGKQMNFVSAIDSAGKIIDLYKRISASSLSDFSDEQLVVIKGQAQSDFNLFTSILNYQADVDNSNAVRTGYIAQVNARRDPLFTVIWQFIAYGVAKNTDANLLEVEARATIQSIKDQSAGLAEQLGKTKKDADQILIEIKAIAAEQGVSQQAIHFNNAAEEQERLAKFWLKSTYGSAVAVVLFAVGSLFLHKLEWFKPANNAEMFQLISSKILIFSVLGYLLILAARNYANHKHNSVVNRHRQNALLTYRALVESAGDSGTGDIVLAHAASCIFSPQETGFTHGNQETAGSKSVLELMTKTTKANQ